MMLRSFLLIAPLALAAACSASHNDQPKDAAPASDAGVADASCFTDPRTPQELINACTDAVKVYKNSHPPLLNADGTLPPLP